MKIGLVLEGGGLRGMYTNGVLDAFLDAHFMPDYIIGVSAGACNGVSYAAGQRGRGRRVIMDHVGDPRYLSLSNYMKTRSLFGMEFIFHTIPEEMDYFDYDAFLSNPCEFVTGVTDLLTGRPAYFDKSALDHDTTVLMASSSIPIFSPPVFYRGRRYLDGGTSDPIPVKKALADGCDRVVVVLTRNRDYRKAPEKWKKIYHHCFRHTPAMAACLDRRHLVYNAALKTIRRLEKEGRALVIAPTQPMTLGRFDKDPKKLEAVYRMGLRDAKEKAAQLLAFAGRG